MRRSGPERLTCLTPGVSIATARGPRAIEDLRPGDRIVTRDNGLRDIVWTGARSYDFAELGRLTHLQPVLLAQGSLGAGLPERDMVVTPNQRILVACDRTMLTLEGHEAFVAAKHLENCRTIRPVPMLGVTFVHVMCDRHEVALANGCWCELFQPADRSLNGVGNAQRNELAEIFPALARGDRWNGAVPGGRRN